VVYGAIFCIFIQIFSKNTMHGGLILCGAIIICGILFVMIEFFKIWLFFFKKFLDKENKK
jgi:hypothetical protein